MDYSDKFNLHSFSIIVVYTITNNFNKIKMARKLFFVAPFIQKLKVILLLLLANQNDYFTFIITCRFYRFYFCIESIVAHNLYASGDSIYS